MLVKTSLDFDCEVLPELATKDVRSSFVRMSNLHNVIINFNKFNIFGMQIT